MLRIAIPNKGRLAEETRKVFDQAGLELVPRGEHALTASLGGVLAATNVGPQDVPEFVAHGAAAARITGLDLIAHSSRRLKSLTDLGFGR